MKGYKGFGPGLICQDKQYAENTIFEEERAELCTKGMHFCENPWDVLDHYPMVNNDGTLNEYAEVEALDRPKTDGKKSCSAKLRVGAKLSFGGFVSACVDFLLEKTRGKGETGDYAKIGSAGNFAKIGSAGDYAKIGSAGFGAQIGSAGNCAQNGSAGDCAKIGSAGNFAKIGSAGNCAQIGSAGDYAKIGSAGNCARIGSTGKCARIGSTGNCAQIGSAGDYAQIVSEGENSVICCAGHGSTVSAKAGSWITLAEWMYDDSKSRSVPKCVKTEYVDGERIKADTPYMLKGGEFVEAD